MNIHIDGTPLVTAIRVQDVFHPQESRCPSAANFHCFMAIHLQTTPYDSTCPILLFLRQLSLLCPLVFFSPMSI